MHARATSRVSAVAAFICGMVLPAQGDASDHDLRESVTKRDGTVVRGRILSAFGTDEVVLVQGREGRGSKVRIRRSDVDRLDSLNQRMAEFFRRRDDAAGDIDKLWKLTQWAGANQLEAMARLQAYEIVLAAEDHSGAHQLLGHRKSGKQWLWRRGDSFKSRKAFEAYVARWGHPWLLELEHYRLRTNAPLDVAIAAAFDLEALYVEWYRRFGEVWQLHEVLDPIRFELYRNEKDFPSLASSERPYVLPDQVNDVSRTFVDKERQPVSLLATATQHLIYRGLVRMRLVSEDPRSHVCAWLELGLGQWMESCFRGASGRRRVGPPALPGEVVRLLAKIEHIGLANFIHRDYTQFLDSSRHVPTRWAVAHALTHYLLAEDGKDRKAFLNYVREVFGGLQGDSSRTFDRTIRRIEDVEADWREWLRRRARNVEPKPDR